MNKISKVSIYLNQENLYQQYLSVPYLYPALKIKTYMY